jgi:ABC-2 type transport system permease protein
MNWGKSWTITAKDFAVVRKKPSVLVTLFAFPLVIGVGLPALLGFLARKGGREVLSLVPLMDAFSFFFIIGAVMMTTSLASYSIVGEKVEKSLEPLLATPTTDGEILLGKTLAALLPTLAATYLGASIFMVAADLITSPTLGYYYYPNGTIELLLAVVVPLAALLAVEANVIVSSRVSDVRTAQQAGVLIVLPFAALYVLGETSIITLDTTNLLWISAALVALTLGLSQVSRATFRREEILTNWR